MPGPFPHSAQLAPWTRTACPGMRKLHAGTHRQGADPEQAGQARPGRGDRDRELLPGIAQLGIDAAQVIQTLSSAA